MKEKSHLIWFFFRFFDPRVELGHVERMERLQQDVRQLGSPLPPQDLSNTAEIGTADTLRGKRKVPYLTYLTLARQSNAST